MAGSGNNRYAFFSRSNSFSWCPSQVYASFDMMNKWLYKNYVNMTTSSSDIGRQERRMPSSRQYVAQP